MKIVYESTGCLIMIQLDRVLASELGLSISPETVRASILSAPRTKLKPVNVFANNADWTVSVQPWQDTSRARMPLSAKMDLLEAALPEVIIAGISTVRKAGMHRANDGKLRLVVEGTDMARVMTTPGVDATRTRSNSVMEVASVLGVEAARQTLINEVRYVMDQHHIDLSRRHLRLIADYMTWTGEVLGINRFGMGKIKQSVMMLASFERTADHLFDAALHRQLDPVSGVSECIIMGQPVPLGTGMFSLKWRLPAFHPLKSSVLDDDQQADAFPAGAAAAAVAEPMVIGDDEDVLE